MHNSADFAKQAKLAIFSKAFLDFWSVLKMLVQ